jgi:hypothetical protein
VTPHLLRKEFADWYFLNQYDSLSVDRRDGILRLAGEQLIMEREKHGFPSKYIVSLATTGFV